MVMAHVRHAGVNLPLFSLRSHQDWGIGDIAAIPVDGPFGYALGVVSGARIFVFGAAYDRLGTVDLLTAKRAFRVG